MSVRQEQPHTHSQGVESTSGCPFEHSVSSQQKTARPKDQPGKPIEHNGERWHIHGFEEARAILRSSETAQAGFGANLISRVPGITNTPILYLEGKEHQQQRKQTARFFAPKVVSDNYRPLMERLVASMLKEARQQRRFDLSNFSRKLAVRVAGEVVGLTDSILPGMDSRLEAFFHGQGQTSGPKFWRTLRMLANQRKTLSFFYLDVKPAIRARQRQLKEDVISYLVSQNYNNREILTECVTYAAAGMVTTREFISVATWHLMERPELRARYLSASEKERYTILHEILRLEPVVSHLYRSATSEIKLSSGNETYVIPQGAKIDIAVYSTNQDERVLGEQSRTLCPERELKGDRIPNELMSFGDGHHRCPGSFIAIQETDILLYNLLALEGLRIERQPDLSWNDFINSYELRKFILAID
ncbi:cytochrome P450 [Ktedonosporobacter rubrisoli]|uniref:Cytochrome P450 n=1 Tax=Ktedonosporobacter rubrisoli TaxID=2509675 RepID=A0A4P6JNT1_KTERU|nr:cytochrome P450 [Ktedonosporobacter rubrisoli]QBD76732.1 cytochrome P450 [Ktedonosporobacter rubrisoli]